MFTICSHPRAVELILRERARHGRSNRHHGEIQPGQRRPRRRRFSLRKHPPGRGPFVRPARTRRCRAGLEALVADPAAARRPLRHPPGRGRQQGRQAQSHSRGIARRQAGLARHRLRPRRSADRSGDSRALRLSRSGHARDVHRARLPDHSRCVRPGKTQCRICPPLRRRRCAPASRPDLQSVTHPHRDRHPGPRCTEGDRRWPSEDADLGHCVQARVGNPQLRAPCLFRSGRHREPF